MISLKNILLAVSAVLIFSACAAKQQEQEYNKPALYWYNKMIKQIATFDLDQADDTYVSLESEHKNSPLLPTALMIMANAHIDEEQYQMAEYYLDEYSRKYGFSKNIDYIRYLKIKAKFLAFKNQFREQQLLLDTIKEIDEFIVKFPNSPYLYLVQTIQSRLYMAKATFDKEISELYTRLDKPKASKYYDDKAKKSWNDLKQINKVDVPWYRWIFE